MVNPGSFQGSRKEFLLAQKAAYAEAVIGGYVADALADIQRRYFKRYPIDLPHDEEPSQEHLANVDDASADAEPEEPNRELLSKEDFETKMTEVQQRADLIRFRKAVRGHIVYLRGVRNLSSNYYGVETANQALDGLPAYEGQRHRSHGAQPYQSLQQFDLPTFGKGARAAAQENSGQRLAENTTSQHRNEGEEPREEPGYSER